MKEKPHPAIMNREEARAVCEEHFARQMALLRDLADYGSNLIIRAFDSSPEKKWPEIIVCCVLLKQLVAMVDATEVLLSAGCGLAAFLPARAAFEALIYAEWILKSDSDERARRYIVRNYRDERTWTRRTIPGTREAGELDSLTEMAGFNVHSDRPDLAAKSQEQLAEVNRIMAMPGIKAIDEAFEAARKKRKKDVDWYALDGGPSSIRQLAIEVERLPFYEFFYSNGARVAHSGSYKDHVRFVDGEVRLVPIRHLADINVLFNFVCAFAFDFYRMVLRRYRSGEEAAFNRKYLEDWQGPFMNAMTVNYDFGAKR